MLLPTAAVTLAVAEAYSCAHTGHHSGLNSTLSLQGHTPVHHHIKTGNRTSARGPCQAGKEYQPHVQAVSESVGPCVQADCESVGPSQHLLYAAPKLCPKGLPLL
jgi:hypothetical protein